MEVVSSLTLLDWDLGISGAVDNPHGTPIGFNTFHHETFEVWLWDSMPSHDVVEVKPKKHLSILVLGMEVVASDGHDALVRPVVYVAGHGGPLGDALNMVGHDPSMLEISAMFHAPNQFNPTTKTNLIHLENKDFFRPVTVARELILLDIGPGVDTSKLSDAIHNF